MTVNLGEMISSIINISYQVWVLKFYEVIEILGMFLQETGERAVGQLAGVAALCAACGAGRWLELSEALGVAPSGDVCLPAGADMSRSMRLESLGAVSGTLSDLLVGLEKGKTLKMRSLSQLAAL